MTYYLPYDAHVARLEELRARAAADRRARPQAPSARPAQGPLPAGDSIAIRCATPGDAAAIARLAALDGAVAPAGGAILLAEVDGDPRAAIHVASGATIADPFRPTAELVELLTLRASRLRDEVGPPRRRRLRALLRAPQRAT